MRRGGRSAARPPTLGTMPFTITANDLPLISAGAAFCGSGGGGSPRHVELMLGRSFSGSATAFLPTELDPDTPCFAPAFAGSTMLLEERLPGLDSFGPLIEAAERWIGRRLDAVCSGEGGGTNALTPFLFSEDRIIIDADFSGRAVPTLDRSSLFLDRVPGLFTVCDTGANGISLVRSDRAEDVDRLMRASMIQAGGVGNILVAGFTAGDLVAHAIHGHLRRSLEIGTALIETGSGALEELASRTGAELIGHGRVVGISQDRADPHVHTTEIAGVRGEVLRLVARSEYLAVLADGVPVAAAPDFIVALDERSRELVEVTELRMNRHVAILTLPADEWWHRNPERARRVAPSSYGLHGLEPSS